MGKPAQILVVIPLPLPVDLWWWFNLSAGGAKSGPSTCTLTIRQPHPQALFSCLDLHHSLSQGERYCSL
jgi:hypothetical protein